MVNCACSLSLFFFLCLCLNSSDVADFSSRTTSCCHRSPSCVCVFVLCDGVSLAEVMVVFIGSCCYFFFRIDHG